MCFVCIWLAWITRQLFSLHFFVCRLHFRVYFTRLFYIYFLLFLDTVDREEKIRKDLDRKRTQVWKLLRAHNGALHRTFPRQELLSSVSRSSPAVSITAHTPTPTRSRRCTWRSSARSRSLCNGIVASDIRCSTVRPACKYPLFFVSYSLARDTQFRHNAAVFLSPHSNVLLLFSCLLLRVWWMLLLTEIASFLAVHVLNRQQLPRIRGTVTMKYSAGCQIWVKCDDGEWWPAKVHAPSGELCSFLAPNEDCFAEFYHNPGQLYPIISTNHETVRPFHARASEQSADEAICMQKPSTQAAVRRALDDKTSSGHATEVFAAHTHSPPQEDWRPSRATPFSSDELANIRQLLGAVNPTTASQIYQHLEREGVRVSSGAVSRLGGEERAARKRPRYSAVTVGQSTPWESHAHRSQDGCASDAFPPMRSDSDSGGDREDSPDPRPVDGDGDEQLVVTARTSTSSSSATGSEATSNAFIAPAEEEVLDVIRAEAFENQSKYVLPPTYRFLDMLGAVSVENQNLYTALPSPQALREVPPGGFDKNRRVLLVPLASDYSHTMGWMRPLEMEGQTLSMELEVNETVVPVPANWNVAAAKETSAVKTAITCDITDLVLGAEKGDLIKLHVRFLNALPDMELWVGVIACVFVEEIDLVQLSHNIVSNYTPSRRSSQGPRLDSNSVVAATSGTVSIICPISGQVMRTPVRSATCQHLQCMDLMSVLAACSRANIWNCALCGEPITPDKVRVNYRLRDWLSSNRPRASHVKAILETAPGQPLIVQYRVAANSEAIVVDD